MFWGAFPNQWLLTTDCWGEAGISWEEEMMEEGTDWRQKHPYYKIRNKRNKAKCLPFKKTNLRVLKKIYMNEQACPTYPTGNIH